MAPYCFGARLRPSANGDTKETEISQCISNACRRNFSSLRKNSFFVKSDTYMQELFMTVPDRDELKKLPF